MDENESLDIAQETPAHNVFVPPSVHERDILCGSSYTHHSTIPQTLSDDMSTECCLGIDEAGRGPVLGKVAIATFKTDLLMNKRSYGLRIVLFANITAS